MKKIIIKRNYINDSKGNPLQTEGLLEVLEDKNFLFKCYTLERPWLDNENKTSCIPEGKYKVVKRSTAKRGLHLWVKEVPERDLILFHPGNYVTHSEGCILVGENLIDINSDGLRDVTNSNKTMNLLLSYLDNENEIEIKS